MSDLDQKGLEAARKAYDECFPDAFGVTYDGMTAAIRAYLASAAPEKDEPVAAYQWKHTDPLSGNEVWMDKQFWNGHRSEESRPLYLHPSRSEEDGWRPIETAPHNTLVVLAWEDWRDGKWIVIAGYASHGERFENGYSNISHHAAATHWRPLPPPPALATGEGK